MKKGTVVHMIVWGDFCEGVTIEDSAPVEGSDKEVVRVKWTDGEETIENVKDLITPG